MLTKSASTWIRFASLKLMICSILTYLVFGKNLLGRSSSVSNNSSTVELCLPSQQPDWALSPAIMVELCLSSQQPDRAPSPTTTTRSSPTSPHSSAVEPCLLQQQSNQASPLAKQVPWLVGNNGDDNPLTTSTLPIKVKSLNSLQTMGGNNPFTN